MIDGRRFSKISTHNPAVIESLIDKDSSSNDKSLNGQNDGYKALKLNTQSSSSKVSGDFKINIERVSDFEGRNLFLCSLDLKVLESNSQVI